MTLVSQAMRTSHLARLSRNNQSGDGDWWIKGHILTQFKFCRFAVALFLKYVDRRIEQISRVLLLKAHLLKVVVTW